MLNRHKDNELLERVLSVIDFEQLRSLFAARAEKSGIDPSHMNFVPKGRITAVPLLIQGGRYEVVSNVIYLSAVGSNIPTVGSERFITILLSVCHEEGHAVSRTELHGMRENIEGALNTEDNMEIRLGYAKDVGKSGKWKTFYELFDEGVTDKLAVEIAQEYVRQHPEFNKTPAAQRLERGNVEMPYPQAMRFVDSFIGRMSREVGVPKKVVWQSIVRGKFEGVHFEDPELRSLFAEMFSPKFLDTVATASDGDLKKLQRQLDADLQTSWSAALRRRAIDFFRIADRTTS